MSARGTVVRGRFVLPVPRSRAPLDSLVVLLAVLLGSRALLGSRELGLGASLGTAGAHLATAAAALAALVLCATSAVLRTRRRRSARDCGGSAPGEDGGPAPGPVRAWAMSLPLLPVAVGLAALCVDAWQGTLDHLSIVAGAALIMLVGLRQLSVLIENGRLVAALQAREEELRRTVGRDRLTGLASRDDFLDRLALHCDRTRNGGGGDVTVVVVDVDDFVLVNDRLGHISGDAVLERVGARLRACVRDVDVVARSSGDEFALLVIDDDVSPDRLGRRIVQTVEVPVRLPQEVVPLSVTVGLVRMRPEGPGAVAAELFLHRAEVALRVAKQQRKGSYVVWRPGMHLAPTGVAEASDDGDQIGAAGGAVRAGDLGLGAAWARPRRA